MDYFHFFMRKGHALLKSSLYFSQILQGKQLEAELLGLCVLKPLCGLKFSQEKLYRVIPTLTTYKLPTPLNTLTIGNPLYIFPYDK